MTTVITEHDWSQLESDWHAHGVTIRRVYPQSAYEIFIAVRHPDGARMLTILVDARDVSEGLRQVHELPRTRGLEMQFVRLDSDSGELRVVLTDADLHEVFSPLASDIAAAAHAAPSAASAVLEAVRRFSRWREMLQNLAAKGLAPQSRRGLFGELTFLRDQFLTTLPASRAVHAWTGPTGAHQDFQLPNAAIEVKTSSGKEPQTLVIASERELDDTGTNMLVLVHYSLDERRGGSGESLNVIIDRTRELIPDAAAREILDDLLVRVGYLRHQRELYDEPRYTVRKQHFWNVTGGFPRITEADLRPGVGDCEYRISLTGLEEYALVAEDVLAVVLESIPNE